MVDSVQPSRQKADLAEVVEMLLDKGVVINADIAVSVGDTQLLGIQLRAALASFETAAKYGLEFPEGTDMERLAAAVDDPSIAEEGATAPIDATRGVNVSGEDEEDEEGEDAGERSTDSRSARPNPDEPTGGDVDVFDGGPLDTGDGDESEESDDGDDADGGEDERAAAAEAETGDGGGGDE